MHYITMYSFHCSVHSVQCTLYSALYISALCTVHCAFNTIGVFSKQGTVLRKHYTVQHVQCTVYSIQGILKRLPNTVFSIKCTVYSIQCIVYSVQGTV